LVLPGEEDFGIAPVEAQACGRPVVALGRGGACETVEHGVSGWLVQPDGRDDVAQFAEAMSQVDALPLSPADLHARVDHFSLDRFDAALLDRVSETLETPLAW
ncbi:MAG: glycosyltransferase, partial [Acidobacteria bacterium]|nr:glycosyltransferase [Acidobacteriota bacterium]